MSEAWTHGDRRTYQRGCRCLPCCAANAQYAAARRAGDPAPDLVSATQARAHLFSLHSSGVGARQAARLAGLSEREIWDIRSGRRTAIELDTERRILAVQPTPAPGQRISGWRTWRRLDALEREGFTKGELARRLGNKTPKLQIAPEVRGPRRSEHEPMHRQVTVRTARRVQRLYRYHMDEGPEET